MEFQKYIAYYRVSTAKQGRSGLGLEAQRAAVISYIKNPAGIIKEFMEQESGKNDDRPLLEQAILAAKKQSATSIIAKLDRLSRGLFHSSVLPKYFLELKPSNKA